MLSKEEHICAIHGPQCTYEVKYTSCASEIIILAIFTRI